MKVTIYTKDNCSYCVNAKSLLSARGIAYTEQRLNQDFTREHLTEMFPSAKTYPVIVVDGFYIGGYDQLKKMLSEEVNTTQKFLS